MRQLEGGMHLRQHQPDDEHDPAEPGQLFLNLGLGYQEALGEEGRRHQQSDEEHEPQDDVVLRAPHVGVGAVLESQRLADVLDVLTPLEIPHRRLGLLQGLP